jgi:WD40 repeat protein
VLAVTFSPDNRFLVAATADGTLRVWNRGFVARQGLSTLSGHPSRVRGIAYSPDGVHFASSDDAGRTYIWSLETGEVVREFAPVGGTVWNLAYSPDGQYLVTCTAADKAFVWDVASGNAVAELTHTRDVEDAEFSSDGRYLVTGGDDHKGILWNTTTWEPESELVIPGNPYPGYVWNVAYSRDGRWIATGYTGGEVVLWNVDATGDAIRVSPAVTFTEHTNHVIGVAFSPDSRYVASASWDGTARIWSTETLTEVLDTPLHHPFDVFVYSVAFSPDGQYLATGARDGRVRLWQLADFPKKPPELIAELSGHTDLVWSISFSPDGTYLASGSWDRTIRRYLVPFDDVWALAELYVEGASEVDMAEVQP